MNKVCTKCDVEKPFEDYSKKLNGKYGLAARCKPCCVEAVMKSRNKSEAAKQIHRDANKKYHKTPKGKAVHDKAYAKWSQTPHGKENIRVRARKHALARYHSDPEYYKLKMRARYHGVPIGILQQIIDRDKVCQMCGADDDLQFDHIIPVYLDGVGSLENLQLLCASCNNFKSNNLLMPANAGMMITNPFTINNKENIYASNKYSSN